MSSLKNMMEQMGATLHDLQNSHNNILRVTSPLDASTSMPDTYSASENMPLTLNEMENPISGHFYDYVNVERFSWQQGEEVLRLDVYASFLEIQTEMHFVAHFLNTNTQEHYATVKLKSVEDISVFTSCNEIPLADISDKLETDNLIVIIECNTLNHPGQKTQLLLLKTLDTTAMIFNANNFDLSPIYTHIYPKKEAKTIVFGDDITVKVPATYQHEVNNIVISLRRAPEQSGDSDYVCNYNSGNDYPYLAIPAKGVIQLGRSVQINNVRNRMAYLEKISSGGVAPITAQTFVADIIDKGTLQFELETNWQTLLKQQGQLEPQTYNFMLSFAVDYTLPSGNMQTLTFLMSSKVSTAIRSGTCIQEPLLPLKIMWGCLAADTLITMADGQTKRIDDVRPADHILSGKERQAAMVMNAWRGTEERLIRIDTENGMRLDVTIEHPLFVKTATGEGYKRAQALVPGDELCCSDPAVSGWGKVVSIELISYHHTVYNLSLDNPDGFYANGILVGDMNTQNAEEI